MGLKFWFAPFVIKTHTQLSSAGGEQNKDCFAVRPAKNATRIGKVIIDSRYGIFIFLAEKIMIP